MTDFLDAFRRGQDAAARAAQARAEIQAVLKGASDELSTAMDGRLRLDAISFETPLARTMQNIFGSSVQDLLNPPPSKTELYIAAQNPRAVDVGWVKLAKFEKPNDGFPCRMIYDKRDITCHDQESFTEALKELLANAWVGEKLGELVGRSLKPEQRADGET